MLVQYNTAVLEGEFNLMDLKNQNSAIYLVLGTVELLLSDGQINCLFYTPDSNFRCV